MDKVPINRCHGGFNLSQDAYRRLVQHHGVPCVVSSDATPALSTGNLVVYSDASYGYWIEWTPERRTDPRVIEVIMALGAEANGPSSQIKLVEVPSGTDWEIEDFNGMEKVVVPRREFI